MHLEEDISTCECCLNCRPVIMHQHDLSVKQQKRHPKKKSMMEQVKPEVTIPCQKSGCLNEYYALQGQPLPIGITFCGVDYPRISNIP